MVSQEPEYRLNEVINLAWIILFEKIVSGSLVINKESSLQLHFSKLIFELGNVFCILPNERFDIEMETNYNKKNLDIVCKLADVKAAIELKCFMKASKRARELDSYDVLKDIERLESCEDFKIKKFFCLTDNSSYPDSQMMGLGKNVSIKNGTIYESNSVIIPGWAEKWKVNRDKPISIKNKLICNWITKSKWHYLNINIS